MNRAAMVRVEKLDGSSVPDQLSPPTNGVSAELGGGVGVGAGVGVGEGTGPGLGEGEGEGGRGPPRLQPQLRLRNAPRSSVTVSRASLVDNRRTRNRLRSPPFEMIVLIIEATDIVNTTVRIRKL